MLNEPKTVPQRKLAFITEHLAAGRTVYIQTALRTTKITPATKAKWDANGHTLLELRGKSLYMAEGQRMVCVDYCRVSAS